VSAAPVTPAAGPGDRSLRVSGGSRRASLWLRLVDPDLARRSLRDRSAAREAFRRVVAEACRPPQEVGVPVTHWSVHLLGDHLRAQDVAVSDRTVARILRDADLKPHRQRMWLTSQDDEFRAKRDDVLRVYYESPRNEHIVCVDEKTGMQALERRYADVPMPLK
jgi:hypothetical protein